ncbi:hypothetical protein H2200_005349 [Cladophialophora chaetospira]|uniref:Carboxylic ester hydrolase n=1 Tax=Cladophialophora chaetospira TaxID=386627 RepID=A0AA38XBY4_9EURO|nr:hypothetical protein H2200_005349 [Cladophialophora chaetospira]
MASIQVGFGQQHIATPCANLVAPVIPEAEVLSFVAAERHNFSFPEFPIFQAPAVNDIGFCNVTLSLRHTDADDTVYVNVWLPLKDWNGRYQATGGGGLAAGFGDPILAGQVGNGYAASTTDGGLTLDNTIDPQSGVWALNDDGTPNEALQLNLAWRSIHDMAVASKDLIKQFYGSDPNYSYWHGCSQGGRQGYAAAAKYPHDFDGILATAPAIDLPLMVPSDFWGPVVMRNSELPPSCVFEEYQKAIIAKCDPLDGATDGLISSHEVLETCEFDVDSLVGKEFSCGEGCVVPDPLTIKRRVPCSYVHDLTVTSGHADVVRKVLEGPRTADGKFLWYGVATGADFSVLAGVVLTEKRTREVAPFVVAENWIKYFALQDPSFDMSKMTHSEYEHGFDQSVNLLSPLWGNQQLDLSGFKQAGGKLLTWFGMADEFINPRGMLRYREGLEEKFGGADAVDEFQRLFFAPGVGHCTGGTGPNPVDPLSALVSWVEEGKAPDVLPASSTSEEGVEISRNLCRYPRTLVYKQGDINKASSFSCSEVGGEKSHDEL